MTAINPAKLKTQTARLGELISLPDQFTAQLHELLHFYGTRVRQTGLSKTSLSLQAYQVPDPVILTLESEVAERLIEDLEAGYSLADALWKEKWVEFRQLAIHVLGLLPDEEPNRIFDKIKTWLETCSSEEVRQSIMTEGMSGLAKTKPGQCLKFIEELIGSGTKGNLQAALFGLELFAGDPSFSNLPILFRYLSRILQAEESGLVKEISVLLHILASRSEQETTYFLVKQLDSDLKPRILRVIRKVMGDLSPEFQDLLREKLKICKN